VPIVEGDQHDPLCATYQTLELARLNDALKECGISDGSVRRAVCETYFFNSGYFLDSCWFGEGGSRFRVGVYARPVDMIETENGSEFPDDR
jgi:hypothetical protein